MGRMPTGLRRALKRLAPAAVAAAVSLGAPGLARAIEYPIFIELADEDDLLDLFNTEQIDEDTFNTLNELLRRGTSLEVADREQLYSLPNLTYADVDAILAYRDEAGRIGDPANLVVAGALTRRKLAAIAPFVRVPRPDNGKIGVDGFARYEVLFAPGDRVPPPMYLSARVSTLRHLTVGFAGGLERSRVVDVGYDPLRDSLSADAPRARLRLPKYFAQWDTEKWGIIAGTYRIGFGQRLVFDTTSRYTPNGFFLDHTVQRRYELTRECSESGGEFDTAQCDTTAQIAPDYIFREGQQGVAVGAKKIALPQGHLQAYGWFSYQPRSVLQSRIRDVSRCPDPQDISNENCAAPPVYHRDDPPLDLQTSFVNESLPNVYYDVVGGANASYFYDRRTHVGVTGFGAAPIWRVQGADLDFQESWRTPYGGPYGAVGGDFAWGRGIADIFGEVARSFDNMDSQSTRGGGGMAAIVRNTLTMDNHEIEISARYYDTDFANPFAGPISQPDQFDGIRARDEAGGRVRHTAHVFDKRLDIRSSVDMWGTLDLGIPKVRLATRADVQATKRIRPGLWLAYQRRDLRGTDELLCPFDSSAADNELVRCRRQRVSLTARSRFDLHRRAVLTLQYRHDFQDDLFEGSSNILSSEELTQQGGELDLADIDLEAAGLAPDPSPTAPDDIELRNGLRQDINAFVLVSVNPVDPLRLRMRWRWLWDDIADNGRWEHSLWGYLDAAYTIRRWAIPSIRYDIRMYVDSRESTENRRNPEHWLRFNFTSRF